MYVALAVIFTSSLIPPLTVNSAGLLVFEKPEFGVKPESLDAILITHTHIDHVKGLKIFEKKYNIPVYITDIMHRSLDYLENYKILSDDFDIKDIHITVIKTSHDAPDSRGYIVSNNDKLSAEFNGIKLFTNHGTELPEELENAIEAEIESLQDIPFV